MKIKSLIQLPKHPDRWVIDEIMIFCPEAYRDRAGDFPYTTFLRQIQSLPLCTRQKIFSDKSDRTHFSIKEIVKILNEYCHYENKKEK